MERLCPFTSEHTSTKVKSALVPVMGLLQTDNIYFFIPRSNLFWRLHQCVLLFNLLYHSF